jgi:hypothetical protein
MEAHTGSAFAGATRTADDAGAASDGDGEQTALAESDGHTGNGDEGGGDASDADDSQSGLSDFF